MNPILTTFYTYNETLEFMFLPFFDARGRFFSVTKESAKLTVSQIVNYL